MKIQYLPMYSDYLEMLKAIFIFDYDSNIVEENAFKFIQINATPEVLNAIIIYLKNDEEWQMKPMLKPFTEQLEKLKK